MKTSQEGFHISSGAYQATGGQVSVKKTKWYLLDFKWDKLRNWRVDNNNADLFIQIPKAPQKIERLTPSEASIILGVWI